jgi:putative permease
LIFLGLMSLGILGFSLFLVGKFVVGDIQQLAQALSVQDTWILPIWLEGSSFQQLLVVRLPPPSKLFEAVTGDQGQLVLPVIISFTEGIGGFVGGVLIISLLSIYWSINQNYFERLWLSLLPAEHRKHARDIWRTIENDLGAYVRSEIIQTLLAAVLLGLGYWLLGSRYATLLALVGAVAWLIPVAGAPLAVILPLLIGLLTSVQLSLFTTLYTLVVLTALQVWVEPRIVRRRWDNPIVTLVILLAMADAFGIVGIIAAPPLSVVCQVMWKLLISNHLASGAATQVSDLRERHSQLWTSIGAMEEQPPPLVISSMERLASLLEKAEPILPTATETEASELFHPSQPVTAKEGLTISTGPGHKE